MMETSLLDMPMHRLMNRAATRVGWRPLVEGDDGSILSTDVAVASSARYSGLMRGWNDPSLTIQTGTSEMIYEPKARSSALTSAAASLTRL